MYASGSNTENVRGGGGHFRCEDSAIDRVRLIGLIHPYNMAKPESLIRLNLIFKTLEPKF